MLVRPFVPHMTKSEIHQIMTCGFATISGSVLVGYIGLGLNAEVLVSSCIMSIPASLAISKLRYPETEEALTAGSVTVPVDKDDKTENVLHAFANGAMLGIKIALSIIASLLCIIALVGLVNGLLTWWGRYLNINGPLLTLQTIFGYCFYPIAFLLGVSREGDDLLLVARLIAEKIITVSAFRSDCSTMLINRTSTLHSALSPRTPPTPAFPLDLNSSPPTHAAVSETLVLWVFRSVSLENLHPSEVVISPDWPCRHWSLVSLPP